MLGTAICIMVERKKKFLPFCGESFLQGCLWEALFSVTLQYSYQHSVGKKSLLKVIIDCKYGTAPTTPVTGTANKLYPLVSDNK